MGMTDPVADMLTRVRNASGAKFAKVDIPSSKLKVQIARIFKDEGYIKNFKVIKDNRQGILRIYLRYDDKNRGVIQRVVRVSRPSRRVYAGNEAIPKILNGLGISILSTSKGILTDREARKQGVGGEIMCSLW
ncbi:MAG: 30S ribosomal protein S8 [Desulfobacteraceae bacterium]|jgi:small subunit ribosomal protein S8|nr:MAG: 30S ribosomal protein S8 [Desulfobacteraceae bacterium]